MVIWLLSNFAWNWSYVGESGMENSILASVGKFLQPIFTPLGFGSQLTSVGWVFAVAAITGLIAKENVIATFGSLALCLGAMLSDAQLEEGVDQVVYLISATGITVSGLISFIAFNMLTIPCFAAVAAAKGEIGREKFKWTLLFWVVSSYLVSAIVYTVGEFVWPIAIWIALIALATMGIVLYNRYMTKKEKEKRLLAARK
ncbi:MAG: hypothetical protein IJ393_02745 [Clostridia bacterium]|nr:hypothetical protein [Clostridia bacterium]